MNVHIIDYKKRVSDLGETFFALILESDVEMVQSQKTGRYYATAKRTSITSTFNEETCKRLIGTSMPGTIQKVSCEEYEYNLPETNEVITLSHRYEYFPEESLEEAVFESSNGANQPVSA